MTDENTAAILPSGRLHIAERTGEAALLIVRAGGRRVALPVAMIRRIDMARPVAMPADPTLPGAVRDAMAGMVAVQGVVYTVFCLSALLGGQARGGAERRVLCLSAQWLSQRGDAGIVRPEMALTVDAVVDVRHAPVDCGEAGLSGIEAVEDDEVPLVDLFAVFAGLEAGRVS